MSMRGFRFFRGSFTFVMLALVTVSLGSCGAVDNQLKLDRAANKDIQAYRDILSPASATAPTVATSASPDFKPMVAVPADLKLPTPLVTVSVNQTVPLRDLLFELGEQAHVDMELDPQIRGSIIFTAKDRPFDEVVSRICEMAGLHYTFKNNILRVEVDRPQLRNYKVDYLNMMRTSNTAINNSVTTSGSSEDATRNAGSSTTIDNKYESDLWQEIDDGLNQILAASNTYTSLATTEDPAVSPVVPAAFAATVPPPLPVDPNAVPPMPMPLPPQQTASAPAQTADPVLATYSISKQSGIVSVFATQRQHKQVAQFLETVRRAATTQVLIEARVLEVSLADEYASGIDWGTITGHNGRRSLTASFPSPSFPSPSSNVFTGMIDFGGGVEPVISALSRFGTVRALSSPRVTVMNNQPAMVNVSENRVYFTIEVTSVPSANIGGGNPTVTYNTTRESVPEGVLLSVLPTVNADTGEIIMAVRPTISKKLGDIEDPVVKLTDPNATITSKVPEMAIQEMDSIIKMRSGQTIVMGGLMRDQNTSTNEGVPLLNTLPFVGGLLFGNHIDRIQKTELVIFLTSTVVPFGGNDINEMDRKVYREFGEDRRPIAF